MEGKVPHETLWSKTGRIVKHRAGVILTTIYSRTRYKDSSWYRWRYALTLYLSGHVFSISSLEHSPNEKNI